MTASTGSSALTGVVERIIFLNEENHYTIAEFRPEARDGAKAEAVTIVGALPGVECGETLHLSGEWTRHSQHGDQFKVAAFKSELPASVYGIRKYLGSGLVPGIGRVYANKIVDAFGTDTFRILSEESAKLRDVPGIGRKRASAIKQAWDGKRTERELYIFLQTYGVSPSQCVKLVRQYGAEAKSVLTNEPYRVAREIDGIGFRTADRIAINLGFANDAPPRLDAGILFAMETLQEEGHTAFGEAALRDHAAEMLQSSRELVEARIASLVGSKALVLQGVPGEAPPGSGLVQLPVNDRAERKIAEVAARLPRVQSALPPIRVDAALEWAEARAGFRFHDLQRLAVRNALMHKLSVLTGGPGTGKTSALRSLVGILKAKGVRVHLAAPTGRAAQRLAEATGGFASTIHRLLKYDPGAGFTANESHPLATDFLIVDEASMLDTRLASAHMEQICKDSSVEWDLCYLHDLVGAIEGRLQIQVEKAGMIAASTKVASHVQDALEFAYRARGPHDHSLVVVYGTERIGKSKATMRWASANPDKSRLVVLTAGTTDYLFYSEIASAIGCGDLRGKKTAEIRQAIRETLHSRDLMLIFDEAHCLFGLSLKASIKRLEYIRTEFVNAGVPVALIVTPQFASRILGLERSTDFNLNQFRGRVTKWAELPGTLSRDDIIRVARFHLPDLNDECLGLLADAAESSLCPMAALHNAILETRSVAEKSRSRVLDADAIRKAVSFALWTTSRLTATIPDRATPPRKRCNRQPIVDTSMLNPSPQPSSDIDQRGVADTLQGSVRPFSTARAASVGQLPQVAGE